MKNLLSIQLVLLCLIIINSYAYPISPRPLRKLVSERQDELDSEYNKESEQKILIDQFVTLTERH